MTPVTDPNILTLLNAPSPVTDPAILAQLNAPDSTTAQDVTASMGGGLERGIAGTAMILPDLINQAVEGPQELYRGLTGRDRDFSPMWKPFFSSEEALQMLPSELRPHDPQTLGGKLAGMITGMAGGLATAGGAKVAGDTVAPFFPGGRNKILGNLLAAKAEDPKAALNNLQNVQEYVPGSTPATGVASGDVGLMGLQRGVETLPASEQLFKDRAIQQTAAQSQVLDKVAGNSSDIATLAAAREGATSPLYEQARKQQINSDAIKPVLADLDKKIAAAGPQNDSGKLLMDLKNKILAGLPSQQPVETGLLDASGTPITRAAPPTMQQPVIGTYRETRDKLALKGMQPGALGAEIKSNITPANKLLGQALEAQSPSFAQAQKLYREGTIPIKQIEAGQAIKGQIQANSPNPKGQMPIVQPKLQQMMENGAIKVDGKDVALSTLTPEQQQGLKALQADLNRNIQATGARVAATPATEISNLAANSAIAKLISHVPYFGGAVKSQNIKMQQELARAMLDNNYAATLLKKAQAPNNQALAQILLQGGVNGSGVHRGRS